MWPMILVLIGVLSLSVSAFPYANVGNTGNMAAMNMAIVTNLNSNSNGGLVNMNDMTGVMSRGNTEDRATTRAGPSTAQLIDEAFGIAANDNTRTQANGNGVSNTETSPTGTMFSANGRNSGITPSSMGLGLPMVYFPMSGVNLMTGNQLHTAIGRNRFFDGTAVNIIGTEGQSGLNFAGNSFPYVPLGQNLANINTGVIPDAAANVNGINSVMNNNAFIDMRNFGTMNAATLGNTRLNTMDSGNFNTMINVANQNTNLGLGMAGEDMANAARIETLAMNAALDTNNEISRMRNTGNEASPDSNQDNMRLVNMNINMGNNILIDRLNRITPPVNGVQMANDITRNGAGNMDAGQRLVNTDRNMLTNGGVDMMVPIMSYTGQDPVMMNGMSTGSAPMQGPDCNIPSQANPWIGNAGSAAMNTIKTIGRAYKKRSYNRRG